MKFSINKNHIYSNKFGIEIKIFLDTTDAAKLVTYSIPFDGETINITPALTDSQGARIGKLEFLDTDPKLKGMKGIPLFDAVERNINVMMLGMLNYSRKLQEKKYNELEKADVGAIRKIAYIVEFLAKKHNLPFSGDYSLKTKKSILLTLNNVCDTLLTIMYKNNHESIDSISYHTIKSERRKDGISILYDENIYIDAESYFNGSLCALFQKMEDEKEKEITQAKSMGANLLLGLANGDIGSKEFDSKIG